MKVTSCGDQKIRSSTARADDDDYYSPQEKRSRKVDLINFKEKNETQRNVYFIAKFPMHKVLLLLQTPQLAQPMWMGENALRYLIPKTPII